MRVVIIGVGLLLCLGAANAAGQDRQFGIKVGPTFASIAVEPAEADEGYDTRVGVAGGGFLVLPVAERIGVQLEALFVRKGTKLDVDSDVTSTLTFDYLEFPLLARVTLTRSPSRSFHLFAGPSVGIRVRARHALTASGTGFNSGIEDDIGKDVERFEASVIAGAGVDIGRHVVVDGRYSWGVTDVNRDTTDGAIRNRTLTILAGYRF